MKDRDLSAYFWKENRTILYVKDSGGDENFHIYAVDLVFHNAYGPDKPWFYDPALSGGGCVMDLGVHLVEQLPHWLAALFIGRRERLPTHLVHGVLSRRGDRDVRHADSDVVHVLGGRWSGAANHPASVDPLTNPFGRR